MGDKWIDAEWTSLPWCGSVFFCVHLVGISHNALLFICFVVVTAHMCCRHVTFVEYRHKSSAPVFQSILRIYWWLWSTVPKPNRLWAQICLEPQWFVGKVWIDDCGVCNGWKLWTLLCRWCYAGSWCPSSNCCAVIEENVDAVNAVVSCSSCC